MPLAAAGIIKLGHGVMPLAASTTIPKNIMSRATATPLAAVVTAVTKHAGELRPSAPSPLPPLSPRTAGTWGALPSSMVRGSWLVNKG